jgi:hypothetical protein
MKWRQTWWNADTSWKTVPLRVVERMCATMIPPTPHSYLVIVWCTTLRKADNVTVDDYIGGIAQSSLRFKKNWFQVGESK